MHISLQLFALKGAFSETFAEEILRSISTSMSTVPCNWNDHFDIFLIFGKDSFKAVTQIEEIFTLRNFALQNFRLDVEVHESTAHLLFGLGLWLHAHRPLVTRPLRHRHFVWIFAVCPQRHCGIVFFECSSLGFESDRLVEHINFFIGVSVVNKFGVIVVIFSWLQKWLVSCKIKKGQIAGRIRSI